MNDRDALARKSLYNTTGLNTNTFLVAGYETTRYNPSSPEHNSMDFRRHDSYAITWALYALSVHSDVQMKLRDELFTIQPDNPTMDELNSLSIPCRISTQCGGRCVYIHLPLARRR